MCGIVAASSYRNVTPFLLEGLRRLEYRGYDSCGVAVIASDGSLRRERTIKRVVDLIRRAETENVNGCTGIAHTRWATHGTPAVRNAHPIVSRDKIALVHNGIIENFAEIKAGLVAKGYEFTSQTDSEAVAHLLDSLYEGNLTEALAKATTMLRGSYAFAAISVDNPGVVVGARRGSPMVLGVGSEENFLASDVLAIAGLTEKFVFLNDGDVAEITSTTYSVYRVGEKGDLVPVNRDVKVVPAQDNNIGLGPYNHFMQKEIFEQPKAVADTLEGVTRVDPVIFGKDAAEVFSKVRRILIIGCGTSYYAGLTAKYWIEEIAGLPCGVEIASEYRYRVSIPRDDTLVVCISQSGETKDTISALEHAQGLGMRMTLAICNVPTSALVTKTLLSYVTKAGVEVSVASTKAFTTQLTALYLLTLCLAKIGGKLSREAEEEKLAALRHVPAVIQEVLALEPQITACAEKFARTDDALFLGRGMHYPIALEGALKLKEISYIHAEAYPAGELKHGPLALVDENMPVAVIAPSDNLMEKLQGNIQEVRARDGRLYVFADKDSAVESGERVRVVRMPGGCGDLSPLVYVVAMQLLAYYTATIRGTDVDKPRNLAKAVTVE